MSFYHAKIPQVWIYPDRRLTGIAPSETLRHSNDAVKSTYSTEYVKMKEILNLYTGRWRVKFDMYTTDPAYPAYGQIYRNRSPYGAERSTTSTSYVTFSEDLVFVAGDLIQLYCKGGGYGISLTYVRNFRLCGDPVDAVAYNTMV